jgi:hypothetical protein
VVGARLRRCRKDLLAKPLADSMQHRGYGLPRINLPRNPVNRGKRKGRSTIAPAPTILTSLPDAKALIRWGWLPRSAPARGGRQAAPSDRVDPSRTSARPPCRPPCDRSRCSRRPLPCRSAGCPGTRPGASKRHAGRDHVFGREDVLHRQPKVGERLHEGGGELRPGLQVEGAWELRGMADVAWRQGVHFGLRRVGIVERFDPPSDDGLVVFC